MEPSPITTASVTPSRLTSGPDAGRSGPGAELVGNLVGPPLDVGPGPEVTVRDVQGGRDGAVGES
jgi:hypothetical protein